MQSDFLCLTDDGANYLVWKDSDVPIAPGTVFGPPNTVMGERTTESGSSATNEWIWFLHAEVSKRRLQPANAAQPT